MHCSPNVRSIRPIGRFAPSPSGDLHFGSLLAAVASYLQAKQSGGTWIIRVEDIDPPREVAGSAQRIIQDLSRLGMVSDEPVLFQSQRTAAYERACQQLLSSGQAFWCGCSRADLPESGVYPGTCRDGLPAGREPRSIRMRVNDQTIGFPDRVQGQQRFDLRDSVGDFVVRRADGLIAYQLAVVVDDAFQNVSEVVRGADLLDSTPRQIYLQQCLGLPTPAYAHVPVVLASDGSKLSKSTRSDPVRNERPPAALRMALAFLGHEAPKRDLAGTWEWALENWSLDKVPRVPSRSIEEYRNPVRL